MGTPSTASANPSLGPVQLLKVDLSDGFYQVNLNINDISKLGVVFPTKPGAAPMAAVPLVLPMGWVNSPPVFSTGTETVADVANQRLRTAAYRPPPHHLDDMADAVTPPPAPTADAQPAVATAAVSVPLTRDPSLPSTGTPVQYVDIFVDDFISLAQEPNLRRVRQTLLHTIDHVFRPLSAEDSQFRSEPVSLKKLRKGDCSWDTVKTVLGWVVDTVNLTIHLPPHRIERLWEILDSIPRSQRRTSTKKWHTVLGEL